MSEDTASQSRRTSPLMVIPVHCLVVPLQFGLESGNDATARPLNRSLTGAVVVNRPRRNAQAKKPLTREIAPCGNELKNSHGRTLKENCEIRKKRMDKLRNPQHSPDMTTDQSLAEALSYSTSKLDRAIRRDWDNKSGDAEEKRITNMMAIEARAELKIIARMARLSGLTEIENAVDSALR